MTRLGSKIPWYVLLSSRVEGERIITGDELVSKGVGFRIVAYLSHACNRS